MKPAPVVEIKGSTLPVLRVVVRDAAPEIAREALAAALGRAAPLLAESIVVLDLRACLSPPDDTLADAVRASHVRFAGALVTEDADPAAHAALGLPLIEAPESVRESNAAAAAPAAPAAATPPLVLTRPLRSGQRVYAQGRDLVVLAPTSRGAELIADGSVYAFVPLRGRVLAGAGGETGARIVAAGLDAELVAIAGVYRTLEAVDTAPLAGRVAAVSLERDAEGIDRLVVAPAGDAALSPLSS